MVTLKPQPRAKQKTAPPQPLGATSAADAQIFSIFTFLSIG
jgi:hypothetical protein